MKKQSVIIIVVGLFILMSLFVRWTIAKRNAQREWPDKQLRNAMTLGAALSRYRQLHGSFPERLDNLVAGGTLDQTGFERLKFRFEPSADTEEWLYQTPTQFTDIAIVGPMAIIPWNGHSGYTVTARADGGGELILGTKRYLLPAWAKKSNTKLTRLDEKAAVDH